MVLKSAQFFLKEKCLIFFYLMVEVQKCLLLQIPDGQHLIGLMIHLKLITNTINLII